MDLNTFIVKNECECLNEADDHPLSHALTSGDGHLASDCDEQLIINISFNQVILHYKKYIDFTMIINIILSYIYISVYCKLILFFYTAS